MIIIVFHAGFYLLMLSLKVQKSICMSKKWLVFCWEQTRAFLIRKQMFFLWASRPWQNVDQSIINFLINVNWWLFNKNILFKQLFNHKFWIIIRKRTNLRYYIWLYNQIWIQIVIIILLASSDLNKAEFGWPCQNPDAIQMVWFDFNP